MSWGIGSAEWQWLCDFLLDPTCAIPKSVAAVSGAVAGPHVDLDLRDLYLKDLTLLGCTFHERAVFENLVGYVERNEIRPLIAATYPLAEIVAAQERFLAKDFVGKIVLVPPQP